MQVLSQDELPRFAVAANTLAMAVKSSAGEGADYMGSLYHKFDSVAEKMGRVPFAEQMASKTAYMAQAFGTTLQKISDLMEGARGTGDNYGIGLNEQLAALGMLEKILGTEASSSYESFYKVAEDGAKQLGMSFVNSAGQMLSLPEMLTKLQGHYGASIEGNLKAQAELDKAFGDGANVIKQLYGNTDVLNKHIHALGSNDGLKRAREMAEKMIVPRDRLAAIWTAIRIAWGAPCCRCYTRLSIKWRTAGKNWPAG
ncbi:phage tail tape measure protein [Candidatus Sodalis pierantonius]|uniref:phage tail tape measure protein n=1 Tax=Candidatus Sodalis pierantonii TaxID=1486991 RepID=UPI00214E4C2E|nr:phage tail tape measure protein [Candidatus Sodalis pierantonius]